MYFSCIAGLERMSGLAAAKLLGQTTYRIGLKVARLPAHSAKSTEITNGVPRKLEKVCIKDTKDGSWPGWDVTGIRRTHKSTIVLPRFLWGPPKVSRV